MGKDKIRHFRSKGNGHYFEPSASLRALGFYAEALGSDEARAKARALELNAAADEARRGGDQGPRPARALGGTLARFAEDLKASSEYADKSQARQDELDYSLNIILPVFGPSQIRAIKPAHVDLFYSTLRSQGSTHKAARVMKDLRYLLNRAVKFGLIAFNPALAVKVKQPAPRKLRWSADQVEAAIAAATAQGFHGAALALGIAYDTGLRPGDIRALTWGQVQDEKLALTQSKTGREIHCPLYPETVAAIRSYVASLGAIPLPSAPLIRTRRGRPYQKDRLARDIRAVLRLAGVPDQVQMRDLRRTVTAEEAEAGATAAEMTAGRGWSHRTGVTMQDTYAPASLEMARSAKAKRRAKT